MSGTRAVGVVLGCYGCARGKGGRRWLASGVERFRQRQRMESRRTATLPGFVQFHSTRRCIRIGVASGLCHGLLVAKRGGGGWRGWCG